MVEKTSSISSQQITDFINKSTSIFNQKFKQSSELISKLINNNAAERFLVANNNDMNKAIDQWTKATEWFLSYRPDLIDDNDEAVKIGKDVKHIHIFNFDKQNNSVFYAITKNTQKGRFKNDQEFRFLIYLIEDAIKQSEKRGATKFTVVYDKRGLKFAQIDKQTIQSWQKMFATLALAYPERLANGFVVGSDWLFHVLYSIAKPFMNKDTIKKIKLLSKPEDLQRYIDKKELPDLYGGLYKYPYENKLVSMGIIPESDQITIMKELSAELGIEIDLSNFDELQKQSNIDVNEMD